MERIFLECQVCLSTFNRICDFKSHVNSSVHQKKMVDVFQQDIVNGYVAIPSIVLINQPTKLRQVKQPIIGLSMCFSRGNYGSFYLCHVCEEKINTEKIISHLSSIDHCSNYFNRTNPNALSFSWIPSRNMSHILRREVTQEGKEKRRSELQMLNLPGNLSTQLKSCTYSEVMDILREKTKLVKQLEVKPKKTMIQTYQRDSNREHPLLGLQHLVECICVGQTERRYYLCTLCHLTVPARTIIKHVLSFDHIFCYFRVWHPSTLLARESYREYTKSFAAKMLDLAKQTEKIHGTANVDMKQVRLEPAKFTSVNFTCYAKALEELGSINKENKGSSLITNVTPGNKLEGQCSQQGKMGSCSVSSNSTSSNPASSNLASSNPASSKPASSNLVSSNVASSKPASSNPASSNPASSKASSNPASSKASSSPFSSKASSNPVSSNPDSSNPVSSNPASSKPASSNPASSNPVSSNPASSNPDSSNPVSSNPASSKPASSNPASSKPASSNPASSKPASSNPASSNPASSNSASSSPALTTSLDLHAICYKLHCQNCRKSFRCMSQYCRHVSTWEHKHMLKESRGGEWKPRLGLYKYLIESLRRNHPVTGVPLVVTLVTTQVQNEPLYICFACEDCFSESFVKQHFDSRKHVINTVLYQNPWRLTFAWENHLSMKDLRSMAWEEEMERPNQRMLKILDIPNWMLQSLGTLCYRKVMEKLELQHTLLKRDVPKCETYSKLQQNERFPLLGGQFLVMHDICIKGQQTTDVGFLCLLCCRRLSDDECYTHLFSLQHVAEFIDRFHPGSLNSSIDAETVLDLAKQAAYIHPISHVQVMKLDKPIWETCSYFKALSILMTANKGEGKARLQPPIVPGKKLFPRGTLKDVNKDHVRDNNQKNSRMVEGCEETTSQKSTDNSETTLNKMSVVGAGVTGSRCVESGENAEKGDDKETLTPSEKESEKRGGVFSETGSEEKRNAGNESCQAIKEEKIEEPTAGSGEAPESSQNTDKFYPTETGKERSESSKDVPTQLTQKRKVSPCTVEDVEQEMSHKRQRLTSKEDASCEAPQNLTSSKRAGQKEATTADKGENCKQSHETATYEGNVEIDGDSEESKSQPSSVTTAVSAVTETTSNTAKVSPESNEDVRMTCIKVSESADNADTCPCEDKAKIISNTTVGPLKIATTSKIEGTSETAADSTVTTPTTSMTAISKFTAKSSNCAPDTTKSAAPTSKLTAATSSCTTATKKLRETAYVCTSTISVCTATTSTSSATISSVTSITKSATLSKPLERRTGAAAKVTATSYKAAAASNTGSKAAREAVCRTAPASKVENASNNSENASKTVVASCTVVTSVATAKMTVKGKNTEASVKTAQMKSSVGSTADVAPNIHKAPAALCLIMPKNPPTEPSHNPASKKWQSASPPEVGLNQLMKVKCGEKKQVYCLLCSVRLRGRCHVTDFTHQYNYAKMKSPEQVSELKPSELQRELTKLVTLLAEADRDVGSQSFLTVKVNIDDYKELAALSADKAIGRLKAIMRQKDLMRASSTSTTDTDASPCEVSSQDDESSSKEEGAPAVGPSNRAQSVKSSEPEANDLIPDQLHSCSISNNNKPNANRSVQDAGIAAVKMVKAKCYVPPLATDAAGSFAKTPDTCQETPEKRQQQERSRPELQDTWKVQEGSQKASTVKLLNPDPLSSAATVNTEQQNKPGPRRRAQDVSEHSQVLPMISIGESSEGRSHLSIYLNGHEPIIGLGLMWECRVMTVRTFYLCESCSETLLSRDIVQHMRSDDHQYNFIRMRHPGFLYFWSDELLLPWMKLNILKGIVKKVSKQERFNEMDAQVILLGKEMFKPVWTASFSDALKLVKEIKKQKKLTIPHPSIFSPQQKDKQPESRQSPEESLPTEVQPSQALETDQRSDNGAKQKTEKHPLEEMDGDLDGVKQRSPLDVTRVSPKADPVISPFSGAGTCLSPQEQPEPRPPVSQHQRPIPELQVKQVELHSESPSSSIVCPKTSQTLSVSPRDEYFPTRKRAAVESIETLVRSCTNNPQLEDPLPALCSELQPISAESASESTSVKPAATSTLLSPMDKDTEPGFDEQDTPAIDMEKFDDLMALLRKMKSELNMSPCTSAPGKSETTTSCANNSSESGVERRQDPEPVQTTSNVATKQARWDSKWQMLKVTKNPPSANSLEMFSTAAPEVLSHGNQLVASNASSVITSSPEGSTFTRGDLLFGVTEANAVTQLPSASTADPSDPQNQNDAQSTFGSQPHPSPIYDNPGQIPQPRDNTETDSTGVRQLPINAIVSVRSNRHNQRFMGSYNRQDPTEVNNQVTHSFSTGATVSPSDASGGYGQYRQMAYFANGLSGYFSTEAVGSYTAPANPPVYTESSYQCEGFTTGAPNPSPIYPEQGATRFSLQSFGHILTAPALPEWVKLGLYQQQLLPQQYSSWRSTSLAAGDGTVISEAAYGGAAPVTTPATSSQKMINLNDYRTLRVAPTQSSSNVAAQNVPQTYVNPPVVHYPPGANTEITSQPPANSFFASGGGFYVVEK
ncbi:uncharacterized protein LOC119503881 isoform X6 [Sebastes umbrosus]|uniref:uncharacterized protein LOC119503881 isoform X6 n=1 Tax=Sebastes umbrosus TaxID=72105 RepID=UPI00189F17EA|nr:uncharacterized protein LOC119503881 isoform X6 [Sebastes umbrosus]